MVRTWYLNLTLDWSNFSKFQIVKCTMKKNATVEDFLNKVCLEHELAPSEHFLRVKKKKEMPDSKFFVPQRSDLLDSYVSSPFSTGC